MRPIISLLTFASGWALALPVAVSAQTPPAPIPVVRSKSIVGLGSGRPVEPSAGLLLPAEVVPGQDPVPQDPAAAVAAASANKRIQAFKKLKFDRRPSSILAAWAAPELQPYDPKEEENKGSEEAGQGETEGGAAAGKPEAGAPLSGNAASSRRTATSTTVVRRTAAGRIVAPTRTAPAQPVSRPVSSGAGMKAEEIAALIQAELAAGKDGDAAPTAGPNANVAPAANKEELFAQKKLKREMEMLQRDVTLSRWEKVAEFFTTLPEKEKKGAYEHFLKVLPQPPKKPGSRVPANLQEQNRFSFSDAFVLAGMAPAGFDKKQTKMLAPIVRRAISAGSVTEELVRMLGVEANKADAEQRIDRREAAMLLSELKLERELGVFLPTADDAEAANDREALNLLARYALAMYAKEQRSVWLETAWQVTQAALAEGEIGKEEKQEALRRAVELAPKVREELGPAWLAESFTSRPKRGMEIVAVVGGQVAQGFQNKARDPKYRTDGLQLQKTAVEALLEVAPELAEQWKPTLGLLASGWIVEASYSYSNSKTSSFGPMMERDAFGNIFWSNTRRGGGGQVTAVEPADLLKSQPGAKWAALLDEALQPHFTTVSAQLWLKVNKHEEAFPYIEQLAAMNPRKAKELAQEFLRVWMRNNNPNVNNRTNPYMFVYGFNQRANGIPLTRSKQERNLEELAQYVERLRGLPIGGVDEKLLSQAFVAAHSRAEVYRLETIERVFGDVAELDPVLLGQLLGTMRTNLATIWRVPAVQEKEKTRRSQKEMLEEVANGYQTALTIAQEAMQARGRHWSLLGAVATILHDQNNFSRELKRNSNFADVRKGSFEMFAEGADHYASVVEDFRINQETTQPFTLWFYCAMGASDLGGIDEETVLAKSQLPLIKEALEALPDGARKRHKSMFANQLFTRMTALKPQMKYRYLQAGFEIVGDHPQAEEAKKVWDYYQDLIRELKLEAVVDGGTAVGTEPFGLRIDIVHSPEIERESGGFQKYATNQNNQPYAYNYGRPLENYRDKFHDAAIASLRDHFEILSVTFNSESMQSLRGDSVSWRRTPYAYMLLQARGPQVDRIPTIQLDFDFLDTSGFTVLPVGTSPVAIDASAAADERPFADIEVNQLLDERRADEGKMTLEIKAKAKGLVPDLDSFLELDMPGFVVKNSDDQGAAVIRFADDQKVVETERVWLLTLEPEEAGVRPGIFQFGEPLSESTTAVYQRYNDADLEIVAAQVALVGGLRTRNPIWAWVLVGLAAVGYLLWFFFGKSSTAGADQASNVLRMPEQVTPFTVLGLLQEIRGRRPMPADELERLDEDIRRIEACHFGRVEDDSLDLDKIAGHWLRSALAS